MSAVTHGPDFPAVRPSFRPTDSAGWRSIGMAIAGAVAAIKSCRRHKPRVIEQAERPGPFSDSIERDIERRLFDPGSRIRYWL